MLSALIVVSGVWGLLEAEGVTQLLIALGTIFGVGGNELAAKNVPASEPAAELAEEDSARVSDRRVQQTS